MNNSIYLRRRGKIQIPIATSGDAMLPLNVIASVSKNLEELGYALAEPLIHACRRLSIDELTRLYDALVADLTRLTGAHRKFKPMYPNFPAQVMAMPDAELYLNALLHYWTDGRALPQTPPAKRGRLSENPPLKPIGLGTDAEFEQIFTQIAASNTSLSEQDRDDLAWFVAAYGERIGALLPETIPQKETVAFVASLLLKNVGGGQKTLDWIARYCRTATDVLRLAAALSVDGDISLARPTTFKAFSRPERRLLLGLLERHDNAAEDMLRWKPRWIRLGERLHPGEFAKRFPRAAAAFAVLRDDLPYVTFNGRLETALAARNVADAVDQLGHRPGDFARRLDHLLRLDPDSETTRTAFARVAARVSTPVLLQVMHHFATRSTRRPLRVFFPKGELARAKAIPNTLPDLPADASAAVARIAEGALVDRFRALPPLGRCFVDPGLETYLVPFSQRSASRALRTIVRGSRVPLPSAADTLRFFVWWKNGMDRTDIDLAATLFDTDFRFVDTVTYYNLKSEYGGCHSGDIVDAPDGASEFIDITTERLRAKNVAYVVMTLHSYTQQPYRDLPECFAGWMARAEPNSGEIYDPRTVQDRLDISADTRIAIPLLIDLVRGEVVWCDLALRRYPRWQNNVHGNLDGIQLALRALLNLNKPNLADLLRLHVRARGEAVEDPASADTVFSVEAGTPFAPETIASQFLC